MVAKRIISLLAMFGVVFLISCYDVQLDKAADENWYEGLTEGQVMEGMEIKGSLNTAAASTKAEGDVQEVEVTWEWPLELDEPTWEVNYRIDSDEADNVESGELYNGKIYSETSSKASLNDVKVTYAQTGSIVYLTLCAKITWCSPQTLLTVEVRMLDSNNVPYYNTVTFLVAPYAMNCKIRPGVSDAEALSKLYKAQPSILQSIVNLDAFLYQSGNVFTMPVDSWTIAQYRPVFFGIESNFSSKGFGTVRHQSSSSYCKVTRDTTASGARATFKYSFEDLPKDRLRYEPGKAFDYNDVVFYVDLL